MPPVQDALGSAQITPEEDPNSEESDVDTQLDAASELTPAIFSTAGKLQWSWSYLPACPPLGFRAPRLLVAGSCFHHPVGWCTYSFA